MSSTGNRYPTAASHFATKAAYTRTHLLSGPAQGAPLPNTYHSWHAWVEPRGSPTPAKQIEILLIDDLRMFDPPTLVILAL